MKTVPKKKRTARLQVVAHPGCSWLVADGDGVLLATVVVYNATRTRIMGIAQGLLKIQLAAPATFARANATLIDFVALRLGIPRARIACTSGGTSARKRLRISLVSYQAALLALSPSPA